METRNELIRLTIEHIKYRAKKMGVKSNIITRVSFEDPYLVYFEVFLNCGEENEKRFEVTGKLTSNYDLNVMIVKINDILEGLYE